MSTFSAKRKYAPPAGYGTAVRQGYTKSGVTVSGRDLFAQVKFEANAISIWQNILININNLALFPWVGHFSKLFGTYKFLDMKFVYEPACSSITNGSVVFGVDPDPTAAAPKDFESHLKLSANTHGNIWGPLTLNVPQALIASRREYYTRDNFNSTNDIVKTVLGTAQVNFDPLEYFPGLFSVFAERGGATTEALLAGKIYCVYTVQFGKAENATVSAQNNAVIPNRQLLSYKAANYSPNPGAFVQAPTPAPAFVSSPQILVGYGMPFNARGSGVLPLTKDSLGVYTAPIQVDLQVIISAAGTSANNFAANCSYIDINGYTGNQTVTTAAGIQAEQRWETKETYSSYTSIWDVTLNAGDTIKIGITYGFKLTQWAVRFLPAAYAYDEAGTQA